MRFKLNGGGGVKLYANMYVTQPLAFQKRVHENAFAAYTFKHVIQHLNMYNTVSHFFFLSDNLQFSGIYRIKWIIVLFWIGNHLLRPSSITSIYTYTNALTQITRFTYKKSSDFFFKLNDSLRSLRFHVRLLSAIINDFPKSH